MAGRKPTPPDPHALQSPKIDTTDPDTRLMKRAGGRGVQGYNVQVVASPEQVILAAVSQSHNDGDQLAPMVQKTMQSLGDAGVDEPVGTLLGDGGYWNSRAISEARGRASRCSSPRRTASAPSSARSHRAKVTRTAHRSGALHSRGEALYRRRQQIVEPVFAHTKVLRRADRFLRRGLAACQSEGQRIAATHNLLKLWRAGVAGSRKAGPRPVAA